MVKYSKDASAEGVEILEPPATAINYYEDTLELYANPDTPAHYEVVRAPYDLFYPLLTIVMYLHISPRRTVESGAYMYPQR